MLPTPEIQSKNLKPLWECDRCGNDGLDGWRPSTLATAEVQWWIKKGIATWRETSKKWKPQKWRFDLQAETLNGSLAHLSSEFEVKSEINVIPCEVINAATLCNDSCNDSCMF